MDQNYRCMLKSTFLTRETVGRERIDENLCRSLSTDSGRFCLLDGDENRVPSVCWELLCLHEEPIQGVDPEDYGRPRVCTSCCSSLRDARSV